MKQFFDFACKVGLPLPTAQEQPEGRPSFTLLSVNVTFWLMIGSLVALHVNQKLLIPTCTSIMTWVIAMVFYKIRNLSKAKLDLDDRSIDLEGEPEKKD